jgi:hypothetical protein
MVIFHSYVSLPEGILLMSFLHQPIFADRTDHKKHDQLTGNTCSNANGWRHGNCWWDFHWIMLHCKSNKYPYGSSRIFLGSGTGVWFGGLSTFLDSVWIHRVWITMIIVQHYDCMTLDHWFIFSGFGVYLRVDVMHYRITKTVSLQLDSLRPILIRTKLGRRKPSSHISERSKFYPRTMKLALSFCVTLFVI